MINKRIDLDEFEQKIRKGLALSEERLLQAKAKEDGELVLYRNGQIVHVKARDLLREREQIASR
jgi:tRNA(Phe) wybutosine-synthesizing methylase Tyw3